MNFLNQVVLQFPSAISFAPGRPMESLFQVEAHVNQITDFVGHLAQTSGTSVEQGWRGLGQYNRTNGTIHTLIARQLQRDEDIVVDPEAIVVTVGAQEAMAILLMGLFEPSTDILLTSDPTYVGITGLAKILGIEVVPVPTTDEGLDPAVVRTTIHKASRRGRIRALYDIPDFNNPLGVSLPYKARLELIDVCREHDVLILEDNPYGLFNYEAERLPTLKALDRDSTVIYVGSFSKTIFPGLRLGYLVADQQLDSNGSLLAEELSKVKSLLTVNTSMLSQAVVGAALIRSGYSLEPIVKPKRQLLHHNRDLLLSCLVEEFAGMEALVQWNHPRGGFFLTVTLPFTFGSAELRLCAEEYGVIVFPMQFFSLTSDREKQVRLSFSYVTDDQIRLGIARFAAFVREQCRPFGYETGSGFRQAAC